MARTKQTARRQTPAQNLAQSANRSAPLSVGPTPGSSSQQPRGRQSKSKSREMSSDAKKSGTGTRKLLDPAPASAPLKPTKEAEGHRDAVSSAPEKSLLEFLETLGLKKCVEKVEESGVTSVSDLKDLEEVDLVELASLAGMNLLQRRRFIRAVTDAKSSTKVANGDDDVFASAKTEASDDADSDDDAGFSLFAPKYSKQAVDDADTPTADIPSSTISSMKKLKQRMKEAADADASESESSKNRSHGDGDNSKKPPPSRKRTNENLITWNSEDGDGAQDTSGFGGESYLFGGGNGGGNATRSHEQLDEEDIRGERAHVCCSCVGTHDALEVFVNNEKFSDVTFLVGTNSKAAPEEEEKIADCARGSLDAPEDECKETASALTGAVPDSRARVFAVRGVLAAASPVFRALLRGTMLEASDVNGVIPVPDCTPRGFITMLRFVYTGRPEVINAGNLVETMYCADKYQLDRLMYVCSEYIRHNLSIENVCRFLLESGVWVSAGFMKFVSLHGEDILQSPDFVKLPRAKVMNIIASDALAVHDELQVFEAVVNWGRATLKRKRLEMTVENMRQELGELLALVRFPQMSLDDLLGDVAATGLLDERELFSIIMYWQTRGQTKNAHFRFNCAKRFQRYIELTYESDWDENGVIYWIGSRGGTENFQNPTPTRGVTCAMSSREQGTPDMLTSRNVAQVYTTNAQNSTMSVDLGEDHLLTPNYYSIRHGFQSANYYPRNWVLEGSTDGQNWETLKTHSGDSTINSVQGTGSFEIDISEVNTEQVGDPKYRHFRIRNTGMDHSNSNYLMVCGIEIYGKLFTKEKHGRRGGSRRGRGNASREHEFPRTGFRRSARVE